MLGLPSSFASAMDRPGFDWKNLIIGVTIGQYAFSTWLNYRQYKMLQKTEPTDEIKHLVKQETFEKSQAYGRAKAKFGFVSEFVNMVENVAAMHYNVLPKVFDWAGRVLSVWGPTWLQGVIPQSILMFLAVSFTSSVVNLPLSWYSTFKLEQAFGFNKQTKGVFVTDFIKGQALTVVLGTPVIWGALKIFDYFGDSFYYYIWLFAVAMQVIGITIYPMLIQPLFNKLAPLREGELKGKINALALKLGFPLDKLYEIDGSKRSNHSNAYFFGFPWSKRIVLYDTLLEQCGDEEVVAVLAHEMGHWKMNHTTSLMLIAQVHMFAVFALFSGFISNQSLYQSVGFTDAMPKLAGFVLFNDILQPLDAVIMFLLNLQTRKFEYQADAYAVKLDLGGNLMQALMKIHEENLGNSMSDWIYSAYHNSHPTLPERLKACKLEMADQEKKSG